MKLTFLAILATIIFCVTSCNVDVQTSANQTATQPEATVVPTPEPQKAFVLVSQCFVRGVGVMSIVKDSETGVEYITLYSNGGLIFHRREH